MMMIIIIIIGGEGAASRVLLNICQYILINIIEYFKSVLFLFSANAIHFNCSTV